MGNSVIEENEMKKPYQLISQESEIEKSMDSETKMQTNTKKCFLELQVFENHYLNEYKRVKKPIPALILTL